MQLNRSIQPVAPDHGANQAGKIFDFEKILSIDAIRNHTKTGDIPSVTDEMLVLYRSAAMEAAAAYTGLLLTGQRVMSEAVTLPGTASWSRKQFFTHKTEWQFASHVAWYYGIPRQSPVQLDVKIGASSVRLPLVVDDFGLGCCNPCKSGVGSRLQYVAGYGCEADIPAVIILGMLKYIAHVIENPGDVVIAVNEVGRGTVGYSLSDAANPALASGAIELWRSSRRDAI